MCREHSDATRRLFVRCWQDEFWYDVCLRSRSRCASICRASQSVFSCASRWKSGVHRTTCSPPDTSSLVPPFGWQPRDIVLDAAVRDGEQRGPRGVVWSNSVARCTHRRWAHRHGQLEQSEEMGLLGSMRLAGPAPSCQRAPVPRVSSSFAATRASE